MVQRDKNKKLKVGLLKLGFGNSNSVISLFKKIGCEVLMVEKKENLSNIDILVITGHGNFEFVAKKMINNGFFEMIKKFINSNKMYIGICLGAQILCNKSDESRMSGMKFINADVKKIKTTINHKVPHIGWNSVGLKKNIYWLKKFDNLDFYFAHSYYIKFKDKKSEYASELMYSNYSIKIPSLIKYKNAYGLQFHPEKSYTNGLEIIKEIIKNGFKKK